MLSYHFQKSIKQISDSQSSLRWTKRKFNVQTPLVTSMTRSIVPCYLLINMEKCRILKLISLFSVANYKTFPSFQPPIVFLTEEDLQCCLTGVSTGLRSVLTPSVTISHLYGAFSFLSRALTSCMALVNLNGWQYGKSSCLCLCFPWKYNIHEYLMSRVFNVLMKQENSPGLFDDDITFILLKLSQFLFSIFHYFVTLHTEGTYKNKLNYRCCYYKHYIND